MEARRRAERDGGPRRCSTPTTRSAARSASSPSSRPTRGTSAGWRPTSGTADAQPVVDDLYLELGYRYDSAAVIAEPATEPADGELPHRHPRDLRAQPGSRAPHVFLNRDGARVSTLDLFGKNFVLLAGPRGAAWRDAAAAAAERLGVGLDAYQVAGGDDEAPADGILTGDGNRFRSAYQMAPDGAVLVRPDGFVAWRAADGSRATTEVMTAVLSRVLHRSMPSRHRYVVREGREAP